MMQEHRSNVIKRQPTNTPNTRSMERRGATLSLSNFKFEFNVLNVCKAGRAEAMPSSML
jgi:hypothetical protein